MLRKPLIPLVSVLSILSGLGSVALAVQPSEMLPDPRLEQRARDISQHLRCLVCQNQSIDDSDAPLAKDLRLLVRERLTAGDSNGQVIDYLVARYGEFVLLKPRFAWNTLGLWLAPAIVFIAGLLGVLTLHLRKRDDRWATRKLTPEEQRKLADLTAAKGE